VGPLSRPRERVTSRAHALLATHGASSPNRGLGLDTGPSAVVEHGANPGLVSHFTKQALSEIAHAVLRDGLLSERHEQIRDSLSTERYNVLAHLLDVKSIHIAERDTQIADRPKEVGEFVNTWSVDGFYEEGVAPAEVGWGTHERTLAGPRSNSRG